MFLYDELLVRAQLDERERQIGRHRSIRMARTGSQVPLSSPGAHAVGAPASRRLLQVLAELYGPSNMPDQDPELFSRLAWTGAGE